jgi:hypothetical protein
VPEHDELQSEIPDYVADRLDPRVRARLEAHFAGCVECVDLVEAGRTLAGAVDLAGLDLFAPHPDPAILQDGAAGARSSDASLTRHLETCASCRLEVDVWKTRLKRMGGQPIHARGGWSAHRRAALAAALLAGIVLGAGGSSLISRWGLHSTERPAASREPVVSESDWSGPIDLVVLPSALRDFGPTPRVEVDRNRGRVVFAIQPLLPAILGDRSPLQIVLMREGRQVWSTTMTAAVARGQLARTEVVSIAVPIEALSPGACELVVTAGETASAKVILQSPFTIAP